VIGEIQGQTNPKEIVILIAHLDTISKVKDGRSRGLTTMPAVAWAC